MAFFDFHSFLETSSLSFDRSDYQEEIKSLLNSCAKIKNTDEELKGKYMLFQLKT
jgi:hypothetical protein